ncbi:HPr family phosphocarrier protein [Paenalkalicoccus suaedae]|uniref:HPr family phosphocarrier protein n=1 Tax=Paenalkalicoccus suaedae TaxID=2592382 RepID=A0A859FHH5_9BACI|nr:HPr family phosphocarrier protein [Paenalkalicoccus suaedae]QKS72250.1 HPr family phosphocarrier protein [Paenalkalicoccus suaedae]
MIEKTLTVKRKSGLQARPAALFVQEANRFHSDIFIEKDDKKVNAKSIMGIMSLAVGANKDITLKIDGPDEQEAMDALEEFVSKAE